MLRLARLNLVVLTLEIVEGLFQKRAANVETVGAGIIQNPDHRVGELDLDHLAVRQMIVHQVLALALHRLRDFRVNEAKQLAFIAYDRVTSLDVVPPFPVKVMRQVRQYAQPCTTVVEELVGGLHWDHITPLLLFEAAAVMCASRPSQPRLSGLDRAPTHGTIPCRRAADERLARLGSASGRWGQQASIAPYQPRLAAAGSR